MYDHDGFALCCILCFAFGWLREENQLSYVADHHLSSFDVVVSKGRFSHALQVTCDVVKLFNKSADTDQLYRPLH